VLDDFPLTDSLDLVKGVLAVDVADFAPLAESFVASFVDVFNVVAFGRLVGRLGGDPTADNAGNDGVDYAPCVAVVSNELASPGPHGVGTERAK
jgi:hypothetical protein